MSTPLVATAVNLTLTRINGKDQAFTCPNCSNTNVLSPKFTISVAGLVSPNPVCWNCGFSWIITFPSGPIYDPPFAQ